MTSPTSCSTYSAGCLQYRKEQRTCIKNLPNELLLRIFRSLSLADLGRAACVCQAWNNLSSDSSLWQDLGKFFPYLHIFDERSWKSYGNLSQLEIGPTIKAQDDNRRIVETLQKLFQLLGKDDKKGITLVTMPKGLSLRALVEKYPMFCISPIVFSFIKEELWDIPILKTYKVAIINKFFEESRGLSRDEQDVFVHKMGCEIPKLVEAIAWTVVQYRNGNMTHIFKSMLQESPSLKVFGGTYTYCVEGKGPLANIVVGKSITSGDSLAISAGPPPEFSDLSCGTMAVHRL